MSETPQDFEPVEGWVIVSKPFPRTGKRYAYPETVGRLRREAIWAYMGDVAFWEDWTWAQLRREYGVSVVRCRIVPMREGEA